MTTKDELQREQCRVKDVFINTIKGVNVMTPNIIEYGVLDNNAKYIYELSTGTGIVSDELYGVTVLFWSSSDSRYHRSTYSAVFDSIGKARDYIDNYNWDSHE